MSTAPRDLAAVPFSKVISRDTLGHARTVLTPGSEGKRYMVIIRREGVLSTECLLQVGNNGQRSCQGNSHSLCYHSKAALRVAAGDKRLHFCNTEEAALRLAHTGGKVARVKSLQSGKMVYFVVK